MSRNILQWSKELALPLDFVTQTQAILAMRRRGKTYTASVQAEELLKAKQHVVVIDITGAWWGLKSSADGKSPGFDIVVAGGEHADIPLTPDSGELMAKSIVEDRFSCILDLKLMRKGQRLHFLANFLDTFQSVNRLPVHVFADEADDYIPQTIMWKDPDATKCLSAMDDLVRRGGINGIGCTLITQRPAVINNNVLTQCQILTMLRLTHPADIRPIREWVKVHATKEEEDNVISALPTLGLGSAIVWAPGWPEEHPIGIKHVQIRERETFNSSRTPKAGEKVKQPRVLAKPDIEKLGERIRKVAEEIKANDPAELKKQVAKLTVELKKAQQQKPAETAAKIKTVEKPVMKDGQIARLEKIHEKMGARVEAALLKCMDIVNPLLELLRKGNDETGLLVDSVKKFVDLPAPKPIGTYLPQRLTPPIGQKPGQTAGTLAARSGHTTKPPIGAEPKAVGARTVGADGEFDKPTVKILNALSWWRAVGVVEPTLAQLAPVAGYTTNSSFDQYIARMGRDELILRKSGKITVLDAGERALSEIDPPDGLVDLHSRIKATLDVPGNRIIDVMIAADGQSLPMADVATAAGYTTNSSFDQYIARLGRRELIVRKSGIISPTQTLFPEGLS